MRILIAEDDTIIADGLSRSLRQGAMPSIGRQNGLEADTALVTSAYDLLILDLGLPKLSGPRGAQAPAGPQLAVAGADPDCA
jgi:two-component system OmpR family response regulator